MADYSFTPPAEGSHANWFDPQIWTPQSAPNDNSANVVMEAPDDKTYTITLDHNSSATVNSLTTGHGIQLSLNGSLTAATSTIGAGYISVQALFRSIR